ncbi:MAG: hypothetical protein KY452_05185, partial [Actinobacteria bacterium]|nr:hypothetical protein [Actinomycetota bacterium]
DFWTIPARVETGDIIWPDDPDPKSNPAARAPEGVSYFHAPLAYLPAGGENPIDMRCIFPTLGCDAAARTRPQAVEAEPQPQPRAGRRRAQPKPK